MTRIRWYGPTVILLITVLLVMIAGPHIVRNLAYTQEKARISLAAEKLEQSALLDELSRAFRQVSQTVQPSVVSIRVFSRQVPTMRGRGDMREMLPPDFRQFWEDQQPDGPQDTEEPQPEYRQFDRPIEIGMGSGWVYDEQGHIITNNHVVTLQDNETLADRIEVTFHDGDVREATVVGTDPSTDVAVLKVEGDHFHPARRAAEPVEQGDMVFAFGAPLGFTFSMSQGVVSAKNRQLNILGRRNALGMLLPGYEDFIQTDAAINRGNSGGPLTNIRGEVVGMNSAIATRDRVGEGFIGLGFAIPVNMVEDVVAKLITHGRVARGWLGIEFTELEPKQAATFGYDKGGAVLIVRVFDGPASKAGLQKGDIILKINGETIGKDGEALRKLIASLEPNRTVDMVIFRNGEELTIPVTLADRQGNAPATGAASSAAPSTPQSTAILRKLGIERSENLTPAMAERLSIGVGGGGVIVRSLRPGSILAEAGLMPDTVITEVMGEPVASAQELADALNAIKPGEVARLSVISRDGEERFVFPEMPAE